MYSLDEEKIECVLGNRDILLLAGQESRECCIFISDVGIRGIYSPLTLGTETTRLIMLFGKNVHNHFYHKIPDK